MKIESVVPFPFYRDGIVILKKREGKAIDKGPIDTLNNLSYLIIALVNFKIVSKKEPE